MAAGDRRETLIEAAADLLDRGGPAAVTLRDVGRAAGVSHNAPYRYFQDKSDLLAAVAGRELAGFAEAVDERGAGPMAIRPLMLGYVRWALRHPERFKLTFGRWTRAHAELDEAAAASRRRLIAAVQEAQARGELPNDEPERLSALLLALAHGAADLALGGHLTADGKGRADPEDLVADLFEHLATSAEARRITPSR